MSHTIFLQDLINQLVAEMGTSICNQCSWGVKPCKYMAAKEPGYHTGIISMCRNCFYSFRDVIHYEENIQVIE